MKTEDIKIGATYSAGTGDLPRTVLGIEETTQGQADRGLVAAAGVTVAVYRVPGPFEHTPFRQLLDAFASWATEEIEPATPPA